LRDPKEHSDSGFAISGYKVQYESSAPSRGSPIHRRAISGGGEGMSKVTKNRGVVI
jgi:hypothetical protein